MILVILFPCNCFFNSAVLRYDIFQTDYHALSFESTTFVLFVDRSWNSFIYPSFLFLLFFKYRLRFAVGELDEQSEAVRLKFVVVSVVGQKRDEPVAVFEEEEGRPVAERLGTVLCTVSRWKFRQEGENRFLSLV